MYATYEIKYDKEKSFGITVFLVKKRTKGIATVAQAIMSTSINKESEKGNTAIIPLTGSTNKTLKMFDPIIFPKAKFI